MRSTQRQVELRRLGSQLPVLGRANSLCKYQLPLFLRFFVRSVPLFRSLMLTPMHVYINIRYAGAGLPTHDIDVLCTNTAYVWTMYISDPHLPHIVWLNTIGRRFPTFADIFNILSRYKQLYILLFRT